MKIEKEEFLWITTDILTLSEAVKIAITRCDKWRFATADEFYDSEQAYSV